MAPAVLGYWEIRGLAQPIRLLLEYTGMEWKDKLYKCGGPPDYDKSSWFGEKEKLGLQFPNLPYIIDGSTKITQSHAVIAYIARKFDLCGKTEEEKQKVDMIEGEINDFKGPFTAMCYNPNFNTMKEEYVKNLPPKLKKFSDYLGKQLYFGGVKITYVDFVVYEALDQHRELEPNCLKQFQNLQDFCTRIESLEKIAAYMKSSRFIKHPLNNRRAVWGS